jgi:hypothetical protein
MPTLGPKRFGKARCTDCYCTYNFSCGACFKGRKPPTLTELRDRESAAALFADLNKAVKKAFRDAEN